MTSPVSGPISGLLWVAQVVRTEVDREYYNIDKIRRNLAAIEDRVHRGELSEEEGDEIAGVWIERLIEAQQYQASGKS